ncbi:phosphate:Na+ symporter [Stella humosa]|uniref:Phosphate:Na+ symporter n=1 Tax=Stella humosa TaxID=94 RepID=A0A3N1L8Y9_9PROT|nr:Na/Pi cotransporter family protein [Stella humosa]ROP91153.1 phosphate:Na+ symporter [Stella humosa]BBK34495.1 Na/Pi cotransporter [Stella humosa]
MSTSHVLVSLAGAIALLLWGIHMVHSGVLRAFGANLRHVLGVGLKTRARAFAAGLGVTAILQSSTATAMMATSFAAGGMVELAPALAVMLGANVGTTLITQVLSFDIAMVFPVLLVAGVFAFRNGRLSRTRDLGRVAIGLGLMLLALHLLVATIEPLEQLPGLRAVLAALTGEPLIALLLAAVLTWAAHSSVATILLVMSLAGAQMLTPTAVMAMVLGANLGSAINPLLAGGHGGAARLRLPLGNLANRLLGCALLLPLLGPLAEWLGRIDPDPTRLAVNFHTGFNLLLAAVFILPLPWIARLLQRLLPDAPVVDDPARARHLDPADIDTPAVALANATREILRMTEVLETMLRGSREVFRTADRRRVAEIRRMDDTLDGLYAQVHRYLAAIGHDGMDEEDGRRLTELLAFAVNLEHAGDIVEKNLMELAAKRIKQHMVLPGEATAEIDEMHRRLIEHLQLAVTVLMTGDGDAARRLVVEKDRFRNLERAASGRLIGRARSGRAEGVEEAGLRLDVARDLKRIEAHLAAAAYPLLEASGELRPSRLAT